MKTMIIATLAFLWATSAMAILDTAPNTIGIYLDTNADEVCVNGLVDGMTDFTFYMILTNPSFDSMSGFLAGYHFEGIAQLNSAVLENPDAFDGGSLGDHLVNFSSPLPTSENMLLMTISATYVDFEYGSAILELHGILLAAKSGIGPQAILSDGSTQNLRLSFEDGVTIRINTNCGPVASENHSFDAVKSLYR